MVEPNGVLDDGYRETVAVRLGVGHGASAYPNPIKATQPLKGMQMTCSMSRKGDCFDNAVVESFFASLKREECDGAAYPTRDIARQHIFAYLEQFYNRKRRHSYLGYVSPAEFEAQYPASLRRIA